jgi:hypothetical protein
MCMCLACRVPGALDIATRRAWFFELKRYAATRINLETRKEEEGLGEVVWG